MGLTLSLILAAALQSAGDIKTGQDLLTACTQSDTRACDEFIQRTLSNASPEDCMPSPQWDLAATRSEVVKHIRLVPAMLQASAAETITDTYECTY